ncbi:MAG: hypothetical protein QM749_15840 [Aquabacterium sp.]
MEAQFARLFFIETDFPYCRDCPVSRAEVHIHGGGLSALHLTETELMTSALAWLDGIPAQIAFVLEDKETHLDEGQKDHEMLAELKELGRQATLLDKQVFKACIFKELHELELA